LYRRHVPDHGAPSALVRKRQFGAGSLLIEVSGEVNDGIVIRQQLEVVGSSVRDSRGQENHPGEKPANMRAEITLPPVTGFSFCYHPSELG
jgi:hypothetical protein